MLTELLPQSFRFGFGEGVIELRYTLRSFLELEKSGYKYTDIFENKVTGGLIIAFFKAGLVVPIDDAKIQSIAEIVGYEMLWEHCLQAVLMSFPKPDDSVVQKPPSPNDEEFSFARLRTLICDVMNKSDEFFWNSTLRELIGRWKEYAVAMGYSDEPERVLEFDEEGM